MRVPANKRSCQLTGLKFIKSLAAVVKQGPLVKASPQIEACTKLPACIVFLPTEPALINS